METQKQESAPGRIWMQQLVPLMHTPLWVCRADGGLTARYGGQSLGNDAPIFQNAFRRSLLIQGNRKKPVLAKTEDAVYAVLLDEVHEQTILAGPFRSIQPNWHEQFLAGVVLLWNLLTGESCSVSELDSTAPGTEQRMEKRMGDMIFDRQERQTLHNPYAKEQREQECIRLGDPEGLKRCVGETYEGEYGTLASNPLRQSKNLAVGVITLASRSAIAGGLSQELSFSMADGFIFEIEENLKDPIAVEQAAYQAQLAFAEAVHRKQSGTGFNPFVRKAKDYIFQNMHTKITVKEMAEQFHIHPDYLSALFKKTENKTITAYILEEKLNLCKNLLKYSNYSIQEISAYFAFPSQSYFTRQFKKSTGMTPLRYRQLMRKQ